MTARPAEDLELEIDEVEALPPPTGVPERFRELVALKLKTTNDAVICAAERDFRGIFLSPHDYIVEQVGKELPPHAQWILSCCDLNLLRMGYEREQVAIWTIALPDGRHMIFESARADLRGNPRSR